LRDEAAQLLLGRQCFGDLFLARVCATAMGMQDRLSVKLLLAAEMVVDRRDVGPGLSADGANAGTVESVGGKFLTGCFEQARARWIVRPSHRGDSRYARSSRGHLHGILVLFGGRSSDARFRYPDGDVVAVIEIVSPGNKDSSHAIRACARKAVELLQAGIHLLIVDLFPPNRRNPQGIHKVIWDRLREDPFELPPDKPLTLAAYTAGSEIVAYVEPVAVGDVLPDRPIFLTPDYYVNCSLEATYQAAWSVFPAVLKAPLEAPRGQRPKQHRPAARRSSGHPGNLGLVEYSYLLGPSDSASAGAPRTRRRKASPEKPGAARLRSVSET
jgi:hypothetical protein